MVGLDGLHDLGASERFGAFTFILREGASWRLEGERAAVGLVENLDAFLGLNIEALGPSLGVDAVIYTQGKLSGRVLDWLSSNTMADIQVLHLGDYDPVGLREYIRLRAALGARARIFLPPGLGKLFDDFASSKIMAKDGNQRELMTLVRMAMKLPADAQEVLEHIRRTNCGLEQEAFFLMSWPGLGPHPWRRSEAIF
ncbi:MAG: hypothetical protein HYZ13_03065 [Acidobacteria bacterium]|nr:hypothetical protein [Acidobacteriota bacterium]